MKTKSSHVLHATISVAAMMWGLAAHAGPVASAGGGAAATGAAAATPGGASPDAPQDQAATPPVQTAEAADTAPDQDIVVRAQRRSERLLDVPISVAAVSGAKIEELSIQRPDELFQQLPNVGAQFASNTDGLPIFNIRGVTLLDFSETNDPSVATYVDEVYLGASAVQNGQLFDLERVEVLRGPQGTLYGRNATGGVISLFTRRPTHSFEAWLTASTGSWGDAKLQGAVSGPITDGVRLRVAGQVERRGASVRNYFPGARSEFGNIYENTVLRGTLEIDLASNFLLTANGHYGHYRAQSVPRAYFGAQDAVTKGVCTVDQIFAGDCQNAAGFRDPNPSPRHAFSELTDSIIDNKNWGAWLRGDWDLGGGFSLVSITAHDEVKRPQKIDVDGTGQPLQAVVFYLDHHQTTQELRGNYHSSAIDATVGGFYYSDRRQFNADVPTLNIGSYARRTSKSYAAFGQGTYHLTPTINLTGGVRYTHDNIQFPEITTRLNPVLYTDQGTQLFNVSRAVVDSHVTWRAAADWHFAPSHMLFASVSTGYKNGAVNSALPTSVASVTVTAPETVRSYEAGIKGSFGPPSLFRYSLTGFHVDYRNIQVAATGGSGGTAIITQLIGIDKAKLDGFEAELSASPVRGLTANLNVGYIYGIYRAPAYIKIGPVSLDGKRPVLTPKFSVSGVLRYEHPLSDAFSAFGSVDGRWQTKVYFGPDNLATETQGAYALVNLHLGVKNERGQWSLEGFIKNATNKYYLVHVVDSTPSPVVNATWGQPRTWGLQATKRF